jgi:uncharacterized membrane protein YphA (DoxX/SURF4 family)
MTAAYVLMFCRLAIAATFGWSALGKLRDMQAFRAAITAFRVLPARWSAPLAWAFVGGEVVVLLLLLSGLPALWRLGFALAALLLTLFSAALLSVIRRNMAINCNCFGRSEQQISWYDLVRNGLLLLCCAFGGCLPAAAQQRVAVGAAILLGVMSLVFVVLVTHLEDIVETLRQPFEVQ